MVEKTGDLMTFGERVVYARNKKGLNQKQLAKLIGVRSTRLCSWEKGRRDPTASMIQKIAKALEVSEDWLMGNDDHFSMKNLAESPQYGSLTNEQQQLVIENEKVIGAAFKFVAHTFYTYKSHLKYDDIYGDAAIGLCRAAKIYGANGDHSSSFFSFAFNFVESAILNSCRKATADSNRTISLNKIVCGDEDGNDAELGSRIPAPDEWDPLEYKVLVESVCQKVEPVLSTKEKESFRLWLHGMSSDEIAKTIGVSTFAVRDRTAKARRKCRACFDPEEMFA
ncbi:MULTISPECIES: sigma-70 family RNA polymerase sigma factor [Acutalibacteraceae]|uniref:sigma-70 family RNA polymerase sigma factor n=1 Tax=Acutalibacteraceae TaxID=3082771 RepID=UPI0013E8EAFE|nr:MULTISPECIES: sigma-70 family RNA polymerase sigma factor [Acutalibacteraceae]